LINWLAFNLNFSTQQVSQVDGLQPLLTSFVEAVEKVSEQIFGRDVEKNDLTECATINDLILGKGQVTPENIVLTDQKDFSNRLVSLREL
jgi:hypothetical protein